MSDSRPPYHRRSTRPIPRVELPAPASSIGLEQDRIETLVPCCWCGGHGMVTVEKRSEWQTAYAEVAPSKDVVR